LRPDRRISAIKAGAGWGGQWREAGQVREFIANQFSARVISNWQLDT